MTNGTIAGNSAGHGGGLSVRYSGVLSLTNCTVTGDSAGSGGGLYITDLYSDPEFNGSASLTNTIVAGQASGGDIAGHYSLTGGHNLIGGDPMLAPLGDYGGPTRTVAVLPGSPAIGGGTTGAGIPAADQRGEPRTGHVDIGAFQSQGFTLAPAAGSTPQSIAVGQPFAHPLGVSVTAVNPLEPVDGGVVTFAAPTTGASATLSAATAAIVGGQAAVAATATTVAGTYAVTASGAGVTTPASFALTNAAGAAASIGPVSGSGQAAAAARPFAAPLVVVVTDAYGNPVPGVSVDFAAPTSGASATLTGSPVLTGADGLASIAPTAGTILGSYTVTASVAGVATVVNFALTNDEDPSLVVYTAQDEDDPTDGTTGLREAIAYAESLAGPQTITFDPSVFGKSLQTLVLIHGPLAITGPATITMAGPGAGLLMISAAGQGRDFTVQGGAAAISGMTITGGYAADGGGLYLDGGSLALSACTISGNTAADSGGGLFNGGGSLSLTDCTVSGNVATMGAYSAGGGVYCDAGTTTMTGCTVSGNQASFGGGLSVGGDYHGGGTVVLTNCTISSNGARIGGGVTLGGDANNNGALTILNGTVTRNTAGGTDSGGLFIFGLSGAPHADEHDRRRQHQRRCRRLVQRSNNLIGGDRAAGGAGRLRRADADVPPASRQPGDRRRDGERAPATDQRGLPRTGRG